LKSKHVTNKMEHKREREREIRVKYIGLKYVYPLELNSNTILILPNS
jgi:hypothetical protein